MALIKIGFNNLSQYIDTISKKRKRFSFSLYALYFKLKFILNTQSVPAGTIRL